MHGLLVTKPEQSPENHPLTKISLILKRTHRTSTKPLQNDTRKKLTKSTKLYKQKYPWLHWGGVCEKTENKTNLNCV